MLRTVSRLEASEAQRFAESMEQWYEQRRKLSELRVTLPQAHAVGQTPQSPAEDTESLDALDTVTHAIQFEQVEPCNMTNGTAEPYKGGQEETTFVTRI